MMKTQCFVGVFMPTVCDVIDTFIAKSVDLKKGEVQL